jgi:hypothetical protein
MHKVRVVAAVVAVVMSLSVAAGACGGDDDSSSGKALSKSEYKQKTDAACAAFGQRLEKLIAGVDPSKASDSQIEDLAKNAADEMHKVADDMRAVGYPEGLKDEANQFYDGLDKAADALAKDPNALKTGKSPKEFDEIDGLAKKLDITDCAQG